MLLPLAVVPRHIYPHYVRPTPTVPGSNGRFYYRYKDQAAVKAHMKSSYFREFSSKLAPLMAKPSEIRAGAFLNGSRGVSRL